MAARRGGDLGLDLFALAARMRIARLDTPRVLAGEGPVWDVDEQALFFIDIVDRKVIRHDPARGETRSWPVAEPPSALALRAGGGAVVATDGAVHALDFATGETRQLLALDRTHVRQRFNDGTVDRRGRFLLGVADSAMDAPEPIGGLFNLMADHGLVQLDGGIACSNGPCFAPDGRTLYFSDSVAHSTFAYDYDPGSGLVANKRLLIDTSATGGMPDGATVDADGLIWIALFGAGKIGAFRPDTGKLERAIELPTDLPASVCFGGPDLDRLYIVTIDPTIVGRAPDEHGGYGYVVDGLGTHGLAAPRTVV